MSGLERYLQRAGRRLRARFLARCAAALALTVLAVTAVSTVATLLLVPAAATLVVLRVALLAAVAAAVVLALRRSWGSARVAAHLEGRVAEFGGRLATWVDAGARPQTPELFVLLDRETSAVAGRHPVARVVRVREVAVPALLAAAALALLATAFLGTTPWQLAAQRVLTGELLGATRPRIAVAPGDAVIRRGSDVVVQARARGFAPGRLEINAAFGNAGWDRAPMSATGGGDHSFVLVGVTEPVEYYVTGQGVNSGRYRIAVADLPTVTAVETRYRFPDWTGREDDHSARGDVAALPGTRIDVQVTTDVAVSEAVLVVGDTTEPLTAVPGGTGPALSGSFEITAPGTWYVAVPHEGQLARISDSYLIDVVEDAAPEVAYLWPGHDRKASPIEEVAVQFEAADDFGVEALLLRYAVNGSEWQEVALGADGRHVLRLESLTAAGADGDRPLRPGDVIALHAEARDHTQAARSALYFVDVRPFDMRYRESQQMAGQGGAEGGGFDIAERQRDILTATWNLINAAPDKPANAIADEAEVLAMLQRTLEQQVQTVISRATARGLGRDAEVSAFVESLGRAAEHMTPAAQRLAERDFEGAVGAEQQALRHLVTAESSVRDIDVSLSRGDARGTSGRSLGELMELEMDPQRNRYEMPQQANPQEQPPASDDAVWRQLDELAARQERLARRNAQDAGTLPSQWEQARLRRELEAMREALASRNGAGGGSDAGAQARGRALEQLDRARDALERGAGSDPEERRRAAVALRQAADTLRQADRGDLQTQLTRAGRQVENLRADQNRVMEALTELQRQSLERARNGAGLGSDFTMRTFADTKRRMQADLARLRGELTGLGGALDERSAEGARALDQALDELDEARIDERLAAAAEAFELGQPLYVIGSESLVEQSLARLDRRVAQARRALEGSGSGEQDPAARVRALQQQLAEVTAGGQVDRPAVEAVVRELARLGREIDGTGAGRGPAGGGAGRDAAPGRYAIRGTAAANDAALLRLAQERLDLLEAALAGRDGSSVRAQKPRQPARDSAAAARYFEALSRAAGDGSP